MTNAVYKDVNRFANDSNSTSRFTLFFGGLYDENAIKPEHNGCTNQIPPNLQNPVP